MKPGEYDIFTPFIGKGIPVAAGENENIAIQIASLIFVTRPLIIYHNI
jgi:hypothetical protein